MPAITLSPALAYCQASMSRQKLIVRFHLFIYRLTRGHLGGHLGKAPVLLITTTRPKTGKRVTVPLLYFEDAGDLIVIASNGGRPHHPAWYRHLLQEPACRVQVMGRSTARRAQTVESGVRAQLWPRMLALYAGYASYQEKTDRVIPLVRLSLSK